MEMREWRVRWWYLGREEELEVEVDCEPALAKVLRGGPKSVRLPELTARLYRFQ